MVLPVAPGTVSSVPGLQDQTGVILSGQCVAPGARCEAPERVEQSVAEGVLSLNHPAAASTGKNI